MDGSRRGAARSRGGGHAAAAELLTWGGRVQSVVRERVAVCFGWRTVPAGAGLSARRSGWLRSCVAVVLLGCDLDAPGPIWVDVFSV